jgi:hypothetical protein
VDLSSKQRKGLLLSIFCFVHRALEPFLPWSGIRNKKQKKKVKKGTWVRREHKIRSPA